MSGTFLYRIQDGETEALEKALESSRGEENTSHLVQGARLLIRKCLTFPADLHMTWMLTWESAVAGEIEDFKETGESLQGLFARRLRVLEQVRQLTQTVAQRTGRALPEREKLDEAAEEIRRLEASIFPNWPWPDRPLPRVDPRMIAESRAAVARGEVQTIEELLTEAQAGGSR